MHFGFSTQSVEDPMACHQFHRGTLRVQKGSSRVDSGAWLPRQREGESANRCRLCEKNSEVSRPPLASCRSLCSTAIVLLLVILVRSLRHQGWRDLRWLDRGALLHGVGAFPFDRQWGRSYFHAISQEPLLQKAPAGAPPYVRMRPIGLLVSDSV